MDNLHSQSQQQRCPGYLQCPKNITREEKIEDKIRIGNAALA